jgi:hypothetical protein
MTCDVDELNESENAESSRLYASVREDGWCCTIKLCDACRQSQVPVVRNVAYQDADMN